VDAWNFTCNGNLLQRPVLMWLTWPIHGSHSSKATAFLQLESGYNRGLRERRVLAIDRQPVLRPAVTLQYRVQYPYTYADGFTTTSYAAKEWL